MQAPPTTTPRNERPLGQATFDMELCYQTLQDECGDAESSEYWAFSYIFHCCLFIAFSLNLLAISLYLKGHHEFKKMVFYWLTLQLLAANLLFCIGQLISRDSLVIFSGASQFDRVFLTGIYDRMHTVSKFISNFYTQLLPLGIIALGIHRFGIFVLKGSRISEGQFMTTVVVSLWLIIIPMTIVLTTYDCLYHFISQKSSDNSLPAIGSFNFSCGSFDHPTTLENWVRKIFEAEQLIVPCLDLLIYIIIIAYLAHTKGLRLSQKASYFLLIPPFSIFFVVETSSIIGTFILTTKMEMKSALVAKRIINILDMVTASLIPTIVFATNKEIRQMLPCFKKKRTVVPNLPFLPHSNQLGSSGRMSRRKSDVLSHVSGIQMNSIHH